MRGVAGVAEQPVEQRASPARMPNPTMIRWLEP